MYYKWFLGNNFESLIISPKSSSSAALFFFWWPHFWHRWMMLYSPPFSSTDIGSIIPPQDATLSPGYTSTCLDHRQNGQWLV